MVYFPCIVVLHEQVTHGKALRIYQPIVDARHKLVKKLNNAFASSLPHQDSAIQRYARLITKYWFVLLVAFAGTTVGFGVMASELGTAAGKRGGIRV